MNRHVCYAELAVERHKTTEAEPCRDQSFAQWLPAAADQFGDKDWIETTSAATGQLISHNIVR